VGADDANTNDAASQIDARRGLISNARFLAVPLPQECSMNHRLLLIALASTFAIAACKPHAPAEPAAPAADATPAPAEPAPVAVESAPANAAADVPFDVKGFAGTFAGTLPCADCSGIDTSISLKPDGSYTVHETYQGKQGGFDGDGTWTAEENGKRIRLDPNSKSEQDRLFAVKSKDEIETLDMEGKPITSSAPHALKREGTAP
jgi:copper homeostasis protein (lipoprotein)